MLNRRSHLAFCHSQNIRVDLTQTGKKYLLKFQSQPLVMLFLPRPTVYSLWDVRLDVNPIDYACWMILFGKNLDCRLEPNYTVNFCQHLSVFLADNNYPHLSINITWCTHVNNGEHHVKRRDAQVVLQPAAKLHNVLLNLLLGRGGTGGEHRRKEKLWNIEVGKPKGKRILGMPNY